MLRRSSDSEDSGDYNWRRLWETPNRKSQRRYARAWVHPLPSDLPLPKILVVPAHPTGSSEFIAMSSNPMNQPIEDQFLRWRQEMEAKQEEQAKQIAELREHANRLQQENERLRTRLEINRAENPQATAHHVPLTQTNKGKEPALPDHSDPPANDELSSDSSPLPRRSLPQNNAEAESRKRPPRHSSRAISGARRWMQREASRDIPHSKLAPEHTPTRFRGMAP